MTIGSKIKKLRKSRNMTQKELGELLGLTTTTICKYETDDRRPNDETKIKLSKIFDVTIDWLLKGN